MAIVKIQKNSNKLFNVLSFEHLFMIIKLF